MSADIKQLRTRIKSVNSTLHLTKAMELVASSKIRRANDAMLKSREYADALVRMTAALSASDECGNSPYFKKRGEKATIIAVAGDRGLAGGYNANVFKLLREYRDCEIIPIGKRICEHCDAETVSSEKYGYGSALALAHSLCSRYLDGEFDRLGIICTQYVSMMTQNARILWVLPFLPDDDGAADLMLFEPGAAEILKTAVPEYVAGSIYAAIKESFACEVAARRMAMDSAGKNARQMIDDLTLRYNRARQSTITQEITEIVASSGN